MRSGKLSGIEAGRGVAALLVLGVHTRDHLFKGFGPVPFGDWFVFGHAGVDFFFVLSGFIIAYAHGADINRPERLGHYLQRRFTRIYPFYWAVCLLATLAVALGTHQQFLDALTFIKAVLLLPLNGELPVSVAWTLRHEILFYALFASLIVNRKLGVTLLGLWLLCSLPGIGLPVDQDSPVFSVFNMEFFCGLGAAWVLWRYRVPAPRLLMLCGMAVFFLAGAAEDTGVMPGLSLYTHAGYAVGSTMVVLGLVEAERQGRFAVPRLLTSLGGASYAIYLTHLLAMGAIWQVMVRTGVYLLMPLWLQFIVLFIGSAAIGWTVSRMLELPVVSLTRSLLQGTRRSAVPSGSPS